MFQFITWLFIKVIALLPHSWRQPHFPFSTSSRFYQPSEYFHHVSQAILRSIILNPVARLFQLISITRLPGCATKGANWLPFPSSSFRPLRLLGSSSAFPSRVLLLLSSVSSTRIAASSEFPSRALLPNSLHGSCDFCSIPFSGLLLLHSLLGSASSAFPSWVPSRVCFFCIPFLGPFLGLLLLHSLLGSASSAFPSRYCFCFRPLRVLSSVSSTRFFFRIPFSGLLVLSSVSSTRIFCSPSVRPGNILQFQGHPLLHQLEDYNYRLPSLQLMEPLTGLPLCWSSHSLRGSCDPSVRLLSSASRLLVCSTFVRLSRRLVLLHGYSYVLLSSVSHISSYCCFSWKIINHVCQACSWRSHSATRSPSSSSSFLSQVHLPCCPLRQQSLVAEPLAASSAGRS